MKHLFFILFLFALCCRSQSRNESIVLVNVGNAGRQEIADLINRINEFEPKVIAVDLQFSSDQGHEVDTKLIDALNECNNLVMVSVIADYSTQHINHDKFVPGCLPKFTRNARTGFVNLVPEDDDNNIIRRFSLFEYVDGLEEYSFAFQTALQFDSIKAMRYRGTHSTYNEIDFSKGLIKFRSYVANDFLKGSVEASDISGKIVLIGFLGPGNEDRYIATLPTSKQIDIYGLEFHAQVIAQILEE